MLSRQLIGHHIVKMLVDSKDMLSAMPRCSVYASQLWVQSMR
jgi:hypothetical protein